MGSPSSTPYGGGFLARRKAWVSHIQPTFLHLLSESPTGVAPTRGRADRAEKSRTLPMQRFGESALERGASLPLTGGIRELRAVLQAQPSLQKVWSPAFRPSENPIALFPDGLKSGLRTPDSKLYRPSFRRGARQSSERSVRRLSSACRAGRAIGCRGLPSRGWRPDRRVFWRRRDPAGRVSSRRRFPGRASCP